MNVGNVRRSIHQTVPIISSLSKLSSTTTTTTTKQQKQSKSSSTSAAASRSTTTTTTNQSNRLIDFDSNQQLQQPQPLSSLPDCKSNDYLISSFKSIESSSSSLIVNGQTIKNGANGAKTIFSIKDATITVPTTATINNNVSCSHQKNSVTIQSSSLRPSFSTTTTAKIATSKSATTTKNATSTAKNATIKNSSIEYNNYYSKNIFIGSYIFYYKIFIVIFLLCFVYLCSGDQQQQQQQQQSSSFEKFVAKSSFTASPIASMSSNVKIVSNFSTTTATNTTKSATSIIKNIDHPNPNPNHHRHRRSIVTKLDTIPEQFIILALLPAENAPLITRALRDGQSKWEISTHKSDYWFNDNDNDKNQTVMATNIQQLRASDLQLTIYSEPIENDTERILQSTCEWIKIHKPALILSLLDNYRSFYTSLIAEHFQIPFISMTQNYQNEINQILTTTKTTKTTKATTTTKSTTTTTKSTTTTTKLVSFFLDDCRDD